MAWAGVGEGLASGGTAVGTLTQGPALILGGFPGYGYFNGSVDELRISDVVRYTADFGVPTTPSGPARIG